jgi:hypothetical protein
VTSGATNYIPDLEAGLFADLRARPDATNLVIVAAADVVVRTRRFRVDGGAWRENPLFGATPEALAAVYEREGLPASVVGDPKEWLRIDVESVPFPLDEDRGRG